eukprot:g76436.t1
MRQLPDDQRQGGQKPCRKASKSGGGLTRGVRRTLKFHVKNLRVEGNPRQAEQVQTNNNSKCLPTMHKPQARPNQCPCLNPNMSRSNDASSSPESLCRSLWQNGPDYRCHRLQANNTTCKESDPSWHTGVDLPFPVKVFSFPYRSSRADRGKVAPATEVSAGEKRGVACTNLRGLLTILSQFDHPRCKKLQAEMIQVAWFAMAGLPIVLLSVASEQTPSSQVTTKHNARSTKAVILHAPDHERAQVSGIKQHSEPAQESAPGLNDLVSIITNPKHPRSRECCIDLIAISLRATTGNSELASKLANVLASCHRLFCQFGTKFSSDTIMNRASVTAAHSSPLHQATTFAPV